MAVASKDVEKIEPSQSTDHSSSGRVSDAAASDASSDSHATIADPADRVTPDHTISSPSPSRQLEIPPPPSLRSEEYRQLFRLPSEEVLVQDFNCALHENFLLQGHMYLFLYHICFYSNLFGFETKKIIPFHEITSVRRAKVAAIFPTAIEIITGGKKFFFTSFLSRDEAFKLIYDGWLEYGDGAKEITDQESKSELDTQENAIVTIEEAVNSEQPQHGFDPNESRNDDVSAMEDSWLPPNSKTETVSTSSRLQDDVEVDAEVVIDTSSSHSGNNMIWEQNDSDAPTVPEYYKMVAESKFPIKVEQFFDLFFSNSAIDFQESFHKKCGDKEFRCSSWYSHPDFGHARDVAFQHPIKLYFGARCGSCQEVQKYKVYRNSHLVVETSQEINDVPYADYFRVEGRWDVEREAGESKDCCILRVYVNVAFSKATMFKGKIVQSTVEECREAYAIWIDLAHQLLKQKKLEKEAADKAASLIPNGQIHTEGQEITGEHTETSCQSSDLVLPPILPDSNGMNHRISDPLHGRFSIVASVASFIKDYLAKFCLYWKTQSQLPLLLVISVAVVILLMQVSIVVLLCRPQQIHVITQTDCTNGVRGGGATAGAEMVALLEKRINHLKDEMVTVETWLEKMRREHSLLQLQLKDVELLRRHQS